MDPKVSDMKIYRPVRTNVLFQKFGENNACATANPDGTVKRPFQVYGKTNNVCPLGTIEFYPSIGLKGHNGEDWGAYHEEPIYFNVDLPGMKWWAQIQVDEAQGINLDVYSLTPVAFLESELPPQISAHAKSYWQNQGEKLHISFRFTHENKTFLDDKPLIQVGVFADGRPQMKPEIKLGDMIALADNTGASSGDHLHRSMKFNAGNSMVIGADNGYQGAVSDVPWQKMDKFVLDVIGVPPVKPTWVFRNNLEYGQEGQEMLELQKALKYLKFMPETVQSYPFYGNQTKLAVKKFQAFYGLFSISPGQYFYEKTRAKMNAILAGG